MPDYPHLVQLKPVGQEAHEPSKVYIDSVKQITDQGQPALLISGSFPDACTSLGSVSKEGDEGKLELRITAWRNTEQMCAQVITPYSFIYSRLSVKQLKAQSSVIINESTYKY